MPDFPSPNRAARLARWLTRQSSFGLTRYRLAVLVGVGLVWLGLTGWGSWLKSDAQSLPGLLGDLVYGPLTFLVPETSYGPGQPLSWQWRYGRLAGVILPVLGLYWALLFRSGLVLARLLVKHGARGHVLLFGEGGSADATAFASAAEGDVVMLADASLEGDAERLRALSLRGIVTLLDAPHDRVSSLSAVVDHASYALLWSDADTRNIALACALAGEAAPSTEILVRVEDEVSQRALRQAPHLLKGLHGRLRPVSQQLAALRQGLCNADLIAASRGRVHVRLWGDDPLLMTMAGLILRHNWSIHRGPPMVTVTASPAGETAWRRWIQRHPLLVQAGGVFEAEAQPALVFAPETAASAPDTTRHIVAAGSDDATVTAALDLASWTARCDGAPVPVQPLLTGSDDGRWLASIEDLPLLPPLVLGTARSARMIAARAEDEAAAKIHMAYAAQFGGSASEAGADWRDLPETYVHANRAAADHRAVKLWDAAQAGAMDRDALIEELAITEHRRWCAERLLDGWMPGARDNAKRRHPNLVPWEALSEGDREKDRAQTSGE